MCGSDTCGLVSFSPNLPARPISEGYRDAEEISGLVLPGRESLCWPDHLPLQQQRSHSGTGLTGAMSHHQWPSLWGPQVQYSLQVFLRGGAGGLCWQHPPSSHPAVSGLQFLLQQSQAQLPVWRSFLFAKGKEFHDVSVFPLFSWRSIARLMWV